MNKKPHSQIKLTSQVGLDVLPLGISFEGKGAITI
jgi:hypothetical protein